MTVALAGEVTTWWYVREGDEVSADGRGIEVDLLGLEPVRLSWLVYFSHGKP